MELQQEILSEITVYMKYAKWKENEQRKETWEEICNRNMQMHIDKVSTLEDTLMANAISNHSRSLQRFRHTKEGSAFNAFYAVRRKTN